MWVGGRKENTIELSPLYHANLIYQFSAGENQIHRPPWEAGLQGGRRWAARLAGLLPPPAFGSPG